MTNSWTQRIRARLQALLQPSGKVDEKMRQPIIAMTQMLEMTRNDECSCDDVYQLMDEYVELKHKNADVSTLMPRIHHHLRLCVCCQAELEALEQIVAHEAA